MFVNMVIVLGSALAAMAFVLAIGIPYVDKRVRENRERILRDLRSEK